MSRLFPAAALFVIALTFSTNSWGQYSETVIHSFKAQTDGAYVTNNPVFPDGNGNLYGVTFRGGASGNGSFYEMTPLAGGGWRETQLYSFPYAPQINSSSFPGGNLVRDSQGSFYGMSPNDGLADCQQEGYQIGCGTIWKMEHTAAGWKRVILYSFAGGADDGGPASLVRDSSGNLYGVTTLSEYGSVFELSPTGTGWSFKTLYAFTGGTDGSLPNAIVLDKSGNLFGSTSAGGIGNDNVCFNYYYGGDGCGVIFELSQSSGSWTENTIYSFTGGLDGALPGGSIALDSHGNIFGTDFGGGPTQYGSIFEVSHGSSGWTESLPYAFSNSGPSAGVSFDAAGNLYGATYTGGLTNNCENGCGTAYELSPVSGGWNYTTLYSFTGINDGTSPMVPVPDNKGNLFIGSSNNVDFSYRGISMGIEYELSQGSNGKWTGQVVHDFPSSSDGFSSVAPLVRDSAGNLYGTTEAGGTSNWGTVFELTPEGAGWKETILHSFTAGADGALPVAGLALDSAGNLYGTAMDGGSPNCSLGCGTAFRLSPGSGGSWSFSVLHTFLGGNDGNHPTAGIVLNSAGNVFGTTQVGGSACPNGGCGIVFKLTPTARGEWSPTLLYSFSGAADGGLPENGTIAIDSSGDLYGATIEGGANGRGVVYELSPRSSGLWKQTVIYNITTTDSSIYGALILDNSGNLYGGTYSGGTFGFGTIFELSRTGSSWTKNTLYNFTGGAESGGPYGGVIFDPAGNLFGATSTTAYELSPVGGGWQETTIFTFSQPTPPSVSLVIDPSGNLYGTTPSGTFYGENPISTVFELQP